MMMTSYLSAIAPSVIRGQPPRLHRSSETSRRFVTHERLDSTEAEAALVSHAARRRGLFGLPEADARHAPRHRPSLRGIGSRGRARGAAARLPRLPHGGAVIAYKFLEGGAVGPFTRFAWPTDGRWVAAAEASEGSGIH